MPVYSGGEPICPRAPRGFTFGAVPSMRAAPMWRWPRRSASRRCFIARAAPIANCSTAWRARKEPRSMSVLHRRLFLALIISAGILNYADRQVIAVLKPLLQDALHWTDSDYGYLTAVFQFAAAFAFLGAGWIVDRVGWRWANPLAVGAWSVAAMAHSLARTLGQFTVARIALGATESLGPPTGVKTIAVLFT